MLNRNKRDDTFNFYRGPAKCPLTKIDDSGANDIHDFHRNAMLGLSNNEGTILDKKRAK